MSLQQRCARHCNSKPIVRACLLPAHGRRPGYEYDYDYMKLYTTISGPYRCCEASKVMLKHYRQAEKNHKYFNALQITEMTLYAMPPGITLIMTNA